MMKWSVIQKLKVLLIMALAVILINAVLFCSNTIQLMQVQQGVTDSQEIINEVKTLQVILKDIETSQRSYLLFAHTDDFDAYFQARQRSDSHLQILKNLIRQYPQKLRLISLLEQQINDKLKRLQTEISVKQNQGFHAVQKLVSSYRVETPSHDIPQLINEFIQEEQAVLQQHIQQLSASSYKEMASFSLAACLYLLMLAVLYDLLWRYVQRLQHTESALRQSENRLLAIIDAKPDCVKLIARDGTFLEINPSGLAMMEVDSAEAVIGQPVSNAIIPEHQAAFATLHENICQGHKDSLEFEMVSVQGTRRWMETHAVPLRNESDGTFWHLAVTRDITERKFAQQKIQEQGMLLDMATDAILVRNIDNQILFWNQGAERLYGWKAEEALGENVVDLLYRGTKPQLHDALFTVVNQGEWRGELQQLTKNGKEITIESRWVLVRDEKGQPKSILSVNTEVTQKKQLEAQLLRSQRLESIGTLAGGIAHDLNNVLAPVLMSIELLQIKLRDQQSQRILQTLEKNVRRGANLLKQVLSFARGMEGKQTVVQVRHLLYEIEQIVKQTFPKSITCQTEIPENLWYVSGNTTQLHQVLMNLLVNARDAMPNGGTLKIRVENLVLRPQDAQEGAYIAISVIDTGLGMSPEIQERIFEPFFTTKEVGKGTGLGLSTALGIIKNHGGFMDVCSQLSEGTEFKVYLPASHHQEYLAPATNSETPQGCGELILVVDDELVIREVTKSSLETYNYQVLTANNGVEAVAIYAQHQQHISIVLLDIMMPGMDGAIAIRKLQKINPNVKIIAISGLLASQNIVEVASMGVQAFLAKPCTARELLQTVAAVNSKN